MESQSFGEISLNEVCEIAKTYYDSNFETFTMNSTLNLISD